MVECLAERDSQRLNMVLSPISAALGAGEYTPGQVEIPGRGKKTTQAGGADMSEEAVHARAVQRDARMFAAAAKHGIGIYDGPSKG